jgi:S1-C subfamily serine protease
MRKILIFALAFAVLSVPAAIPAEDNKDEKAKPTAEKKADKPHSGKEAEEIAQHLQDISVTIVSKSDFGGGEGSGVIKTRKLPDGSTVNFVWTAAHVVSNLRREKRIIDSKTGTPKTVVEFDDAMIVKALNEDGRMVGKIEFYAEVIRYSSEEDLALLRVRKKNFVQSNVVFHLEDKIPAIGTELYHVGSLLGQLGSNSMTRGIMSQHGRLIDKKVFDQTTVAAFPGSSGGGVYLQDGKMVGMVVRGAGETFNLIVPVRRLRDWAKSAKVEWAVDDSVKMPTEEELRKLPIEDNGVTFQYGAASDQKPDGPKKAKDVIIIGEGRFYLGDERTERQFPTLYYFQPAAVPQMRKSDE